jgi:flagellin FlaB
MNPTRSRKLLPKRAEMGIGTLIIFIAMILVAAIAAGVLLQTASTLQNKALQTGQKSKGQVSTMLTPILLFADNGTDQDLENFHLKAKLAPGSDPLKLGEMLLSFDLNNESADLQYGGTVDTCVAPIRDSTGNLTTYSGRFFTIRTNDEANGLGSKGTGNFTVDYLINAHNQINGYLQRGDVVEFCFEAPRKVNEDEDISIKLIPKIGTATYIETSTPDIITEQRVVMYP